MAMVAKMTVSKVEHYGGGRWVPCPDPRVRPDQEYEEGADLGPLPEGYMLAADKSSYYGHAPWLGNAGVLRFEPTFQSSEHIVLTAVSTKGDPDDPNREWAEATPAGTLDMTIQNPDAFGYVEPGAYYRVTIERIRGPREQVRPPDSGTFPVQESGVDSVTEGAHA